MDETIKIKGCRVTFGRLHGLRNGWLAAGVMGSMAVGLSGQAGAAGFNAKPASEGGSLEVGLGAHAGFSTLDYDSNVAGSAKDDVNSSLPFYYTGTVTLDPVYRHLTDDQGSFEFKLHTAINLDDPWLDNDRIDELSIELKSSKFGNFYLGEDDGAADRLKPKQAGRVGIAVGHGAFTGITPWWGNLPYGGGTIRDGSEPFNWDWPNGIVGGDWRSTSRDTQDAVKVGYESPEINGFRFGASINLQDTYAGFEGPGTAPKHQDRWDDLALKDDEYELSLQWNGSTVGGLNLSAGLAHSSVHVVNDDLLQKGTDFGIKVAGKLDSGAIVSTSAFYGQQDYDNDVSGLDVDEDQYHIGFDWSKGRWKVGLNYVNSNDAHNAAGTRLLGGGGNEGYSLGADYKLVKDLTLGGGVLVAENDAGEDATEAGLNLTYRFKTAIY